MYCKPTIFFLRNASFEETRETNIKTDFQLVLKPPSLVQDIEDLMLYVKIKSSFVSKLGIREDLFKLTPTSSAPFEPKISKRPKQRRKGKSLETFMKLWDMS